MVKFLLVNRGKIAKQARVNVHSIANVAEAKYERRNGRDVVVVPSVTMPDNVVMNGIMYPAEEIERSYATLNRSPAPLGHPIVGGKFISARDPEGINMGYIGAWNENARRKEGRVFLDKVVDVEVASRSDGGKSVLEAIKQGDPIHTSTGLLANLEEAGDNDSYDFIARDIEFDHDAILLGEEGAATPGDGVGMMVNAKGESIEVINSYADSLDRDLNWVTEDAARFIDKMEKAPLVERIKSAIMEAVAGSERDTTANRKEAEMSDKQIEELSAKVNTLSESVDKIGETVTNAVTEATKPIKDHVDQIAANQKEKDDAELADLQAKIVKANLMDEAGAKELTLNAARALAKAAEPGKAAALNGAFTNGSNQDEFTGVDLNAGLDAANKESK